MRAFRRGTFVYVIAWCLVLLAASPVTAPFSTFVPGQASHQGASGHHPSLDQINTTKDKTVDFDSGTVFFTRSQAIVAVVDAAPMSCSAPSDRHDVLRI